MDLAFYRDRRFAGSLYKLGDAYFVEDGNHRIIRADYHGVPDVEADCDRIVARARRKPRHRTETMAA